MGDAYVGKPISSGAPAMDLGELAGYVSLVLLEVVADPLPNGKKRRLNNYQI